MNRKFLFFSVLLILFVVNNAIAGPASGYYSQEILMRLRSGQKVDALSYEKTINLKLTPLHPVIADIVSSVKKEAPNLVYESLFYLEKTERYAKIDMLALYNIFRAIGSMQGLEYYSASRKTMRILYAYSSLIESKTNTSAVRDIRLSKLPGAEERLFARQEDLTFGDNIYSITLSYGSDFILQKSSNLTKLNYGIIPAAGTEAMNIRVLFIDTDEAFIFYALSSAKINKIPGMSSRIEASLSNRAIAIYGWIKSEMEKY